MLKGIQRSQSQRSGLNPAVGQRLKHGILGSLFGLGLGLMSPLFAAEAASAAEEIRVLYGPIQLSISVESLTTFVEEGRIEPDLQAYASRLSPQERDEIRRILQSSVDVDAIALSNFLYTPQGEAILGRIGDVIRTRSNSGFYALRAALILAVAEEGATPLELLQKFPTTSIVIDIDRGLQIARELNQLTTVTSEALTLIETEFRKEAVTLTGVEAAQLNALRREGSYTWEFQTLVITDSGRDRTFDVDLYLPQTPMPAPIIVLSHGLGSDRTSFSYLARHLASYGFAVVSPEHPGSNSSYVQALFEGAAEQVSEPEEFINRSLDIRYLLDELERRSEAEVALRGRLNLSQVGIIGQSFGGFTALHLAGAEINFQRLNTDCPNGDAHRDTLNISLLLQCRAASLDQLAASPYTRLKDDRVKAVIAINPIGSTVYGPEGFSQVDVPVLMVSGSSDVVAPTLFEQILPFTWLDVRDKYLLLMRNATHFSTIGPSDNVEDGVELPSAVIGPDPQLAQDYMEAVSVAFLKAYISNDADHKFYLSPSNVNRLSRDPIPLSIVQSLSEEQVARLIKDASLLVSALQ